MSMEERRSSRIPTPTGPQGGRPLAEKTMNTAGVDRKRRLDTIPEPSKRQVTSSGATGAKPSRSAPPPATGAASSQPAASFHSQGEQQVQAGPAPGEETFEEIQARTGLTVEAVLSKKMAFKKALKPEKKIDEMVPMIKELRAAGWHLLAGRNEARTDSDKWRLHFEQLETAIAKERDESNKKQDGLEAQIKEMQGALSQTEGYVTKLTAELAAAEKVCNERAETIASTQQQLTSTLTELEAARTAIKEKDSKIKEMENVVRQSQSYSTTLQTYNTSLQNDLKEEKAKRDDATKERDVLQGRAAELDGRVKSLEHQQAYDKEQLTKLNEERDSVMREVAVLRNDLTTTRAERDRLLTENERMTQEVARIRSVGGKSLETLETLTNEKATMEVQLSTQQRLLGEMRQELAMAKEQRALAESASSAHGTQVADLSSQLATTQQALADAEAKIQQGEMIRRKLHNIIQELKGNIRVFCRVRPQSPSESSSTDQDSTPALEFPATNDLLAASIVLQAPSRGGDAQSTRQTFSFDKVFNPTSDQETVFEEISELVQSALDGDKVCIFAYGQTGSGKTYTMLGTDEHPGMIPRAMRQIFETSCKLGSQGWSFTMQASMMEIYNEEIKDLLCKSRKAAEGKKHNIVHNGDGTTTVSDMTVIDVSSTEKVDALLSQAMERRSVSATQLNEQSSRSHMVFMLKIDGTNSVTGQTIAGVLNLVDLAGSERVKESGATGQQLKEAQNINKSLSALGDVIAAIGNKDKHVPFRNSKLTYLLQNCLGGDSKTLMFVNVAPTREFAGETLCSLRFAAKVNACEINPKRQVTK